MQITKRHKIESFNHGDLFSGRLLVESFWWGKKHLNLVCKTYEGDRVRIKSFSAHGHLLFNAIKELMPKIAFYWSGEGQPPKVLNFIRLSAKEVPPGKRAHNSDIDIDLQFERTSEVIIGNPKPISYDDIKKIVKKPVFNFEDFEQDDELWTYGAIKESFYEIDLKSGTYLSAEFVNGQNRHVTLNVPLTDHTEGLLSGLGPGVEILLFGKIHIFHGRKTRIFVNDPEDLFIQRRRLFKDAAIRQQTWDPQKFV
uniref:Uncharacterized protein n=1 Tax=Panagrolaimus sp. ES5 TaxID=591445 RepID=A0AC34G4T6_9BILA